MARKSLVGMLDATETTPPDEPTPQEASKPTVKKTALASVREPEAEDVPRHLTMARKEARITHEQNDALSALTRRLNRERGGAGERITDNTLIRVAVDMLLAHENELRGTTEDELRTSVGL